MDWPLHQNELDEKGFTIIPSVLSQEECEHLTGLYQDNYLYRNTINMKRYRFGQGQYKYFNYPLPPIVHVLRETFYAPLAALANDWMKKLLSGITFRKLMQSSLNSVAPMLSSGQHRLSSIIPQGDLTRCIRTYMVKSISRFKLFSY